MNFVYDDYDEIMPTSGGSLSFGAGVWFKKLTAEIRYSGNQLSFNEYTFFSSSGSKVSFILGNALF